MRNLLVRITSIEKTLRTNYEQIARLPPHHEGAERRLKDLAIVKFMDQSLRLACKCSDRKLKVVTQKQLQVLGRPRRLDHALEDSNGVLRYVFEYGDYKDTTMLDGIALKFAGIVGVQKAKCFTVAMQEASSPNHRDILFKELGIRDMVGDAVLIDTKRRSENKTQYLLSRSTQELRNDILILLGKISDFIR